MTRQLDQIRQAVIAARDARGWTTYRLARAAGLEPSHVARWLDPSRADHQPTITTARLERLMQALELTVAPKKIKNFQKKHLTRRRGGR